MRDLNLKATEYFEAVARLGTVTKAAEELAVSPSAVSQQVATIETQLGVKLFRREKQRLVLTLDGDRMFQTVTQAFGAIRNARSATAHQRDLRNLTTPVRPSFGVRWLGPRIGSFAAGNPDWNIRVDATPDFSAFDTEGVDFDLRYGTGTWSGLTVLPVMHDLVLPLCSPEYLERLRQLSEDPAEQLAQARLIDSVKMLYRWDLWLAGNRIALPDLTHHVGPVTRLLEQGRSTTKGAPRLVSRWAPPSGTVRGVTASGVRWWISERLSPRCSRRPRTATRSAPAAPCPSPRSGDRPPCPAAAGTRQRRCPGPR